MAITQITPEEAARLCGAGALLIDIRSADEHARESIAGAINLPLDRLDQGLPAGAGPVLFHCQGGMRTAANAARLAQAASGRPCHVVAGGIQGWRAAGLPTDRTAGAPLEILRQVQLAAGLLVLAGVLLGWLVDPRFLVLAGFVGAGLTFAGATGWCGMARLLALVPWNRRALA